MDLYVIHLFYIVACVSICYYAGYEAGQKKGTRQTLNILLEDNLLNADKLKKFYIGK